MLKQYFIFIQVTWTIYKYVSNFITNKLVRFQMSMKISIPWELALVLCVIPTFIFRVLSVTPTCYMYRKLDVTIFETSIASNRLQRFTRLLNRPTAYETIDIHLIYFDVIPAVEK